MVIKRKQFSAGHIVDTALKEIKNPKVVKDAARSLRSRTVDQKRSIMKGLGKHHKINVEELVKKRNDVISDLTSGSIKNKAIEHSTKYTIAPGSGKGTGTYDTFRIHGRDKTFSKKNSIYVSQLDESAGIKIAKKKKEDKKK